MVRKKQTRSRKGEGQQKEQAAPPSPPENEATRDKPGLPFPVVGIGASAGGVEAIVQLLGAIPHETRAAFVVVMHLPPEHDSALPEVLQRGTSLKVQQAHGGQRIEPGNVYVISPGTLVSIVHDRLHTQQSTDPRHAVDHLFVSLAQNQAHRAIAVVLSGSASDGTRGVKEIKAKGGITFAQDDTAAYGSMPRSAIASGEVDFVYPPDVIGREISRFPSHPYLEKQPEEIIPRPQMARMLKAIHNATGVDFTHYKQSTLMRRISRRIALLKIESPDAYVDSLQKDPSESQALFQDILINVTSFFRNPEAFEAISSSVLPRLMDGRSRHDPIRIWVLGCSTGEEAYSLAIACTEHLERSGRIQPVQIFATDLNSAGIEKARNGIYSKSIAQDLSPDRLRRFFVEANGAYRVTKQIRDMCVFAVHNGLADPPFSRMDLISCRNFLIYIESEVQQRIIPLLHYALKPGGYLWMGSSETVGSFRDYFNTEDGKNKVYSKKPGPTQTAPAIPVRTTHDFVTDQPRARPRESINPATDVQREADRILLNRYTPPAVVVNSDFDILQFRGDTGAYLAPSPGRASLNLLKMLREGLMVGMRRALLRARKEETIVREEGLKVRSNGGYREISIEVLPVATDPGGDPCFLVLFEDGTISGPTPATATMPPTDSSAEAKTRVQKENARLSNELAATKEFLQSVIEQQEAANEELQSANEEVQSANEELQSINEELETSKEEIQSTNEELATVNDELQNRNLELSQSNNDLANLLASVQLPIVMLGPDLRIRRFTPTAEKILNLISTDIGRPIGDIKLNMNALNLESMIVDAIETVTLKQEEVQDSRGTWYSLRIRPYKTLENRIDGAVLVFVDIDSLKRKEEELLNSEQRFRTLADSAPVQIWIGNSKGLQFANRSFLEFLGASAELLRNLEWTDSIHPRDREAFLTAYRTALSEKKPFESQYRLRRRDGEYRWIRSVGVIAESYHNDETTLVASAFDITDLKEAEDVLLNADRSKNEFLAVLAHELRNPLAPLRNATELLRQTGAGTTQLAWLSEMMDRQVTHIARLVDDLLDVSRITQGKIALRMQTVDLNDVIHRTVETFRDQLTAKAHDLRLDLTAGITIKADPVRMEQVIGNLMGNAIKFTPSKGVIAIATSTASDKGTRLARISIRDTGAGITVEMLPRIFDLFTQDDRSIERTQGGLGIGLTLARSLVLLHGGSISVASDGAEKGSEFTVLLPLWEGGSDGARGGNARTEPDHAGSDGNDSPRRIMVVDDNRDAADTMAAALRLQQHEVQVAHDGIEALQLAHDMHPDVILLDIGLPGMSGLSVARELRRERQNEPLIVAISGYGSDSIRRESQAAGFDYHFTKPMDMGLLKTILKERRSSVAH